MTSLKAYVGKRTPLGTVVEVIEVGSERRPLDPRFDLRNHSPTGFEWGYAGSGPAQLALAIAADLLQDDEKAQEIYQQLKFKVIGHLPYNRWYLTDEQLCQAIAEILVGEEAH
jgi:hypothetical protein